MSVFRLLRSHGKLSVPAIIIICLLVILLVPTIIRLALGAMFTLVHLAITVACLVILLLVLVGVIRYLNKSA